MEAGAGMAALDVHDRDGLRRDPRRDLGSSRAQSVGPFPVPH